MPELYPNTATANGSLIESYRLGGPYEPDAANKPQAFTDPSGSANIVQPNGADVLLFTPSRTDAAGWDETIMPEVDGATWLSAAGGDLVAHRVVFGLEQSDGLYMWFEERSGTWTGPFNLGQADENWTRLSATSIEGKVYLNLSRSPAPELNDYVVLQIQRPDDGKPEDWIEQVFDGLINSDSVQVFSLDGTLTQTYCLTPKPYPVTAGQMTSTWNNAGMNNLSSSSGPPPSGKVGQVSFWYSSDPRFPPELQNRNLVAYPFGDIVSTDLNSCPDVGANLFWELTSDNPSDSPILSLVTNWGGVIWDDHKSGSNVDGALYWAGLGVAASSGDSDSISPAAQGYSAPPPPSRSYYTMNTLNLTLAQSANIAFVWNDKNSKASDNVSLYDLNTGTQPGVYAASCATYSTDSSYPSTAPSNVYKYLPNSTGYDSHLSVLAQGGSPSNFMWTGGDVTVVRTTFDFEVMASVSLSPFGVQSVVPIPAPGNLPQTFTTIYETSDIVMVDTAVDGSNLQQVFMLDNAGTLFVSSGTPGNQATNGAGTYSDPFPIAQHMETFSLTVAGDGTVQLFGMVGDPMTGSHILINMYVAEDGTWTTRPVSTDTGELKRLTTYTSTFSFTDSQGLPLANRPVSLLADIPISLNVNGVNRVANSVTPITVRTNTLGEVVCVAITTDVAAIPLTAWSEAMTQNNACRCDPSGDVQDYLAGVSGSDISDATNADNQPVFDLGSGEDTALADSLNSMMGTIDARSATKGDNKAWMLTRDPLFRYQELSKKDAQQQLEALRAQSISILHVDFGTVFASVKHGIAEMGAVIHDGLSYAVHYVIDGLDYLWEGVMDAAHGVMQMASSLFEWAKAKAVDVFEWLATLFDWDAILNTQKVLEDYLTLSLQSVPQALEQAKTWLDEHIQSLEENLANDIDALEEKIKEHFGAGKTLMNAVTSTPGNPLPDTPAGLNIVQSALANGASTPSSYGVSVDSSDNGFTLSDDEEGQIDEIIRNLRMIVGTYKGSDGFENAINSLSQIASEPDRFLELGIDALLEAIKAIAVDTLELGRMILDVIFEVAEFVAQKMIDFMSSTWTIPLVSDIYSSVTNGESLTVLGLTSLAIALPVTYAYKAKFDEAPFTDAQVSDISNIVHDAGLSAAESDWETFADKCDAVRAYPQYGWVILIAQGATGAYMTAVSALTDTYMAGHAFLSVNVRRDPDTKFAAVMSCATLVGEWVNLVFTNPAMTPGQTGLGKTVDWVNFCFSLFMPVMDFGTFVWSDGHTGANAPNLPAHQKLMDWLKHRKARLMKNSGEWGAIAAGLYGIVHFIGALVVVGTKLVLGTFGSVLSVLASIVPAMANSVGQIGNFLREEVFLPKAIAPIIDQPPTQCHAYALATLAIVDIVANVIQYGVGAAITASKFMDDAEYAFARA